MSRSAPRWYTIRCASCGGTEHGFTAGALVVLVENADAFVTISGGSVCLLTPLLDHVPSSTDPRFAFTEKV